MLARATLSVTALLAFAPEADAHGNLKEPTATFQDGAPTVEWVTMIDNFWDIGSGGDQVGKFKTMAKEKGMSVKDVVLDMVKDKKCGYTRTDVDPQPVPSDGKVKWLGNGGGGFTHTGPCELYLDDKMVLHGDDCEEEFPGGADGSNKMSEMPVDFASCNGKCMLTIYWLAFQNEQWQAYVNCVPVQGSGSATQTQSSAAGPSTEEQTPAAPSTSSTGSNTEEQASQRYLQRERNQSRDRRMRSRPQKLLQPKLLQPQQPIIRQRRRRRLRRRRRSSFVGNAGY
ncbi:hypothetical protein GQ600_25367 [Phytophthora cactorum]|nr:hypothetical protein GQ600_25367 [Phytophthora cactorum]